MALEITVYGLTGVARANGTPDADIHAIGNNRGMTVAVRDND